MRCIAPTFETNLRYAGRCKYAAMKNARLCRRHEFIEPPGTYRPLLIGWVWRLVARLP